MTRRTFFGGLFIVLIGCACTTATPSVPVAGVSDVYFTRTLRAPRVISSTNQGPRHIRSGRRSVCSIATGTLRSPWWSYLPAECALAARSAQSARRRPSAPSELVRPVEDAGRNLDDEQCVVVCRPENGAGLVHKD